jgi:hypothetical protein
VVRQNVTNILLSLTSSIRGTVFFWNVGSDYRRYGVTHHKGRAIAQAVSRWLPTAVARVRSRVGSWDMWWTKWHWGRFSPSTSVSPANSHSTDHFTRINYHPGLVQ